MDIVPMTPQGYEQLQKKLDKLKNHELPRLEKALGEARELGDLSENSEFETARHEIGLVETQIGELENQLANARIVTTDQVSKDEVALGARVQVKDLDKGFKDEFMIVGEGETRDDIDCVSSTSPLGQALMGKKKGETAEFDAPRGRIRYQVVDISYE